jgi:YtkA-like
MTLPQRHRDGETERRRDGAQEFPSLLPSVPPSLHLCASVALWPKLLVFMGLALCASLFQSGCHKTSETPTDIVFEHEIAPSPPRTGSATITLKLADSAGKPINGARINLEGNMSHPGMRPVFSEAREAEPGRYKAALEFTMRGDWFILFHITLPDGRKLEKQIDVKGVQSG